MKVCLVFPNVREGSLMISTPWHQPLGIAYLAAVAEAAGHEVTVIDCIAENKNLDQLISTLKQIQPDVVGITTNVAIARMACLTSKYIHLHGPPVIMVMGGPWATA